jgi:hypothetical protein
MLESQVPWSNNELKEQGSDFNLFWTADSTSLHDSPQSSWPIFPEGQTLQQWQGTSGKRRFIHCSDSSSTFTVVSAESPSSQSPRWSYNETDKRFYSLNYSGTNGNAVNLYTGKAQPSSSSLAVINIDCGGSWSHCKEGDSHTRLCAGSPQEPWKPSPVPPVVDNQGWILQPVKASLMPTKNKNNDDGNGEVEDASSPTLSTVTIRSVASGKCLSVCDRGGDVGGCNGNTGSIVQLENCVGIWQQQWVWDDQQGALYVLKPQAMDPLTATSKSSPMRLYLEPPTAAAGDMDRHSMIADPLFADPMAGDFGLDPASPALALGFQPIPPIHAVDTLCGYEKGLPPCWTMLQL